MMRIDIKKNIIFFLIAIIILSNFVEAEKNFFNSKIDDINIDINTAEKVAMIKLKELNKSNDYLIDEIQIIYNENNLIKLFYIFRLLPKGFIIISSHYYLPPIIAYSFNSNINENLDNDLFIQLLKSDIKLRLDNIERLPVNIIEKRQCQWDKYLLLRNNNFLDAGFEQWPPEGTTPTDGWIVTNWDQNSPYNDFCPLDPNSGSRSVAGCPAIAMAQILNYHKTINNVYFDDNDDYLDNYVNRYWIDNDYQEYDFPSFPELNEYLLIVNDHFNNNLLITNEDKAAITFACGIAAKQVYSGSVSGTMAVDQAYNAYVKFNCDMVELIENDDSYLYDRIIENIKQAYPVHLAVVTPGWDAGHNLVIDGYNTDEFYHLNFGWGGQKDAWYLLPDEIPYGLSVIEGVIVDILYNENGSDLNCNGKISWIDVSPRDILYGNFTIENIGTPGSVLNWSIDSIPDWGTWEFNALSGNNLTPEDGPFKVEVIVTAPDKKGKEFAGGIKIVNNDAKGDNYYIQVTLTTPRINNDIVFFKLIERYSNIFQKIQYFFQ